MKNKLLLLYSWFVRTILFFVPDIGFTMRFRGWLYGIGMKHCGRDFQVTHDAIIKELQNISVGNNVFVGNHTIIMGSGRCIIDDEVQFGPNCVIITGNHSLHNSSYRYGKIDAGQVLIKKGAWVAANCVVVKGAVLPEGSVLAANSFLNKEFSEMNAIYGGVPSKLIMIKQ